MRGIKDSFTMMHGRSHPLTMVTETRTGSGGQASHAARNQTLTLAGGCFWGVERFFQEVDGVTDTQVGYAQSKVENPSYEEVCTGETDAVEAVRITYDPARVTLRTLTLLLLDLIDPFSLNRQGNDRGRQYRSGFYWEPDRREEEEPVFRRAIRELEERTGRHPVVQVEELVNFYPAEESHQDYLLKHPDGYCHIPMEAIADASKRQRYIERVWALDQESYEVTQHAATERPFENKYDAEFRPGIYVDVVSGQPLFSSVDKYDSGCGWPAFSKPIDPDLLVNRKDFKLLGRPRIEVRTAQTGIHLGHVFDDGPADRGGRRYCMNSAALRFVPREEMEAQGYGDFLPLVDGREGGQVA